MGPGLCGDPLYADIAANFCHDVTAVFLKATLAYLQESFAASAEAECANMFS